MTFANTGKIFNFCIDLLDKLRLFTKKNDLQLPKKSVGQTILANIWSNDGQSLAHF
jgi:hypothetical protein